MDYIGKKTQTPNHEKKKKKCKTKNNCVLGKREMEIPNQNARPADLILVQKKKRLFFFFNQKLDSLKKKELL